MAIGYQKLVELLETSINEEKITKFENYVDKILQLPHFLKNYKCGPNEMSYCWWVISAESIDLTTAEKNELVKRYKNAGWDGVEVANSTDNQDDPGKVSITLYMKF